MCNFNKWTLDGRGGTQITSMLKLIWSKPRILHVVRILVIIAIELNAVAQKYKCFCGYSQLGIKKIHIFPNSKLE